MINILFKNDNISEALKQALKKSYKILMKVKSYYNYQAKIYKNTKNNNNNKSTILNNTMNMNFIRREIFKNKIIQ